MCDEGETADRADAVRTESQKMESRAGETALDGSARSIIVLIVVGMFLTPPDVFSQALLAIPMWLLFEAGLIFGRLVSKRPTEDSEPSDQPPAAQS